MNAAPLMCGTCRNPIGERKAYTLQGNEPYHPNCVPTEVSRLRTFVTDLATSGVRFDIVPTSGRGAAQPLSAFYVEYITRIDQSIRERAKAALDSCVPCQAFNVVPVPSPETETWNQRTPIDKERDEAQADVEALRASVESSRVAINTWSQALAAAEKERDQARAELANLREAAERLDATFDADGLVCVHDSKTKPLRQSLRAALAKDAAPAPPMTTCAANNYAPSVDFRKTPAPAVIGEHPTEEEWDCIDCEHSLSAHREKDDGCIVCNADEEIGVDCDCIAYVHPADDPEVNWVCLRCDQQFNDYTAAMHDCVEPGLTGSAEE